MAKRIRLQWPLVWTLCLLGSMEPAVLAQQAGRITINLKDAEYAANWPMTVTLSVDGKPVRFGQSISVSPHWIGTAVVSLHNISPRTIVQAGTGMVFRECGNGTAENPYEAVWSSLGLVPKVVYTDRNGLYHPPPSFGPQPAPLRVPSGGSVRLSFSKYGDAVQAKLAKNCAGVTQANLTVTTLYFADDSRWSAGSYYLAPGAVPAVWTQVTKEEFFRGAKTH